METTLLYFYSAVFQGFAAIIALGSMFFLYFLQYYNSQKENIKNGLQKQYNYQEREIFNEIELKGGIIKYVRERVKNEIDNRDLTLDIQRKLINEYEILSEFYNQIRKQVLKCLALSILILTISIFSLFLVGYNLIINSILLVNGIILIFISLYDLLIIKKIISKVLNYK